VVTAGHVVHDLVTLLLHLLHELARLEQDAVHLGRFPLLVLRGALDGVGQFLRGFEKDFALGLAFENVADLGIPSLLGAHELPEFVVLD